MKASKVPFDVSGTGDVTEVRTIISSASNGRVTAFCARFDAAASVEAAVIELFDNPHLFSGDDPSIPDEYLVARVNAESPAGSATASFVSGPVGADGWAPAFSKGLSMALNIVATGAWRLTGYVEMEHGGAS
jgi:hypothetical protein